MIFIKTLQKIFKTRFDTSNYKLNRPLSRGINKKAIRLMKDELGGKIKTKFVGPEEKKHIVA